MTSDLRRLPAPPQSLLDRAIAYVSPSAGAERLRIKAESLDSQRSGFFVPIQGSYNGARRDRRATSQWSPLSGSANADTLYDMPALRARSRDLLRNSPIGEGAVNTATTNVVGIGLKVRPEINREFLGLEAAAAEEFEEGAERLFNMWANSADCDVTRTNSFDELQELSFRSTLENGDVLAASRFIERAGWPFGYAVQLVEGDRLCNPNFRADRIGLMGGVELDAMAAPVAYHVCNRHPGDLRVAGLPLAWDRVEAFGPSGRRVVHHLFFRKRIEQARGVPFLSTVIETLAQLTRYTDAELMAAVMNACFAITTKSPSGDVSLGLEQDASAAPPANATGAAKNPVAINESGTIVDLLPDESIESFTPARPSPQFDGFVTALLRQVGAALGIPFEVLVLHFEASYSASRAALEMLGQFVVHRRKWVASKLCQPCYENVIAEAIGRGWLRAPGFFADPFIRAAYCQALWVGRPMPSLDPSKDAAADKIYVDMGVKSLERVTLERTGAEFDDVHRQRVAEHKKRADAGLEPPVLGATVRFTGDEPKAPPADGAGGDGATGAPSDEEGEQGDDA